MPPPSPNPIHWWSKHLKIYRLPKSSIYTGELKHAQEYCDLRLICTVHLREIRKRAKGTSLFLLCPSNHCHAATSFPYRQGGRGGICKGTSSQSENFLKNQYNSAIRTVPCRMVYPCLSRYYYVFALRACSRTRELCRFCALVEWDELYCTCWNASCNFTTHVFLFLHGMDQVAMWEVFMCLW